MCYSAADLFDRDVQRQPYPNLSGIINVVDVLKARRATHYDVAP